MSTVLLHLFPFIVANASTAAPTNTFIDTLVKWAAGVGGGIIALFLIYAIVKEAIAFSKGTGNASIWSIIGKILFLILLVGLVYMAMNYQTLGAKATDIGNSAIETIDNEIQTIMP